MIKSTIYEMSAETQFDFIQQLEEEVKRVKEELRGTLHDPEATFERQAFTYRQGFKARILVEDELLEICDG